MKKLIIVLAIILLLVAGFVLWMYSFNKGNNNFQENNIDYQAEKSSTSKNTKLDSEKTSNSKDTNQITVPKIETQIAIFSTKIYNKDEERQNNISITCRTVNEKEVKPGDIFSFCDTIGKSTVEKGYKEADIYVNGKKEQGLGGGNCQVSTTLFNAVSQIPELEIIERHQHSGHVPYVQEGQDAAISYGTYDFKFKNNTNEVIKIIMENTSDNITAKLIKIQ